MSCDGQGLDSDTEYPMYDVTDVLPTDTCTSTIRVVKRVKFSLPTFVAPMLFHLTTLALC